MTAARSTMPSRPVREPAIAAAAALMGDPARANMMTALLDGRARTAKELAFAAGVAPQTASGHLRRLTEGGLLSVVRQGRHRYFRLAGPEVAAVLEGLMALAGPRPAWHPRPPRPRIGADLAAARLCYDHLAGSLGVGLHDALLARGALAVAAGGYGLTATGRDLFAALGVDVPEAEAGRRPLVRPCLDWSERRPHLAGSLAAAFACRCLEQGWIERDGQGRAVRLTAGGRTVLQGALGPLACTAVEAA